MPASKRAVEAEPTVRRSVRSKTHPQRFRPTNDNMPAELAALVRDVAATAAAKSAIPFEADAVIALEEALEPMLESVCAAAMDHATKKGRSDIELEDLQAVSKSFMKSAK